MMVSDPLGLAPHPPTPEEKADLFRPDDPTDLDLLSALLTDSLARHRARIAEYETAKKYQEALHVRGWVQGIEEALAYIKGLRGNRG